MVTGDASASLALLAAAAGIALSGAGAGAPLRRPQLLLAASLAWLGGLGLAASVAGDGSDTARLTAALTVIWVPGALVALWALPQRAEPETRRARITADGAVVAVALSFLAVLLVIHPVWSSSAAPSERVLALLPAVTSLLVVVAGLALLPHLGPEPAALGLFAIVGASLVAASQSAGAVAWASTASRPDGVASLLLLLAAGVLACAASPLRTRLVPSSGRRPLTLLYVPVIATVPVGLGRIMSGHPLTLGQTLPAAGMVLALLARQALSSRELMRLVSRHHHNASHDGLTGLSNRAALVERLSLAAALPAGEEAALLLADLDGFKEINDNFGHDQGDRALQSFATELMDLTDDDMVTARLGGDEFAVLCVGVDATTRLMPIAMRVGSWRRVSSGPATSVQILASVGIATTPGGEPPVDVLRRADLAMYEAKRLRVLPRVLVYSSDLGARAERRHLVSADLATAAHQGELTLAYQPIVRLADHEIVACEALLRWQHPRFGAIAPTEFIGLAEETGEIVQLGTWVVEQAITQLASWDRMGLPIPRIFINTSVRQYTAQLPRLVARILARHGVAPHRLTLEITESQAPALSTTEPIHALRATGIRLALDDFGAGYSTFAQLSRVPVDVLKIDRDFVTDLGTATGRRIVESIVALAAGLGLDTIIEGVETQEQADAAKAAGVSLAQGFLFSHALAPHALAELIAAGRPPVPAPRTAASPALRPLRSWA